MTWTKGGQRANRGVYAFKRESQDSNETGETDVQPLMPKLTLTLSDPLAIAVRRWASERFDSPQPSILPLARRLSRNKTSPSKNREETSSSISLASRVEPHLPTVTGKRFWNLVYNMQRLDPPLRSGEEYRQLRAITILMLPLGLALILPYAIVTGSIFPAVGIAPLVFSGVLGSLIYHNMLRSPSVNASIDVSLSVVYFTFLVPR
jgi:hypothetical protein